MTEQGSSDEATRLQRCLRDVLGLVALPALWRGRSAVEILLSFGEALEATVDIDVVVACARSDDGSLSLVRIAGADAATRREETTGWFTSIERKATSSVTLLPCGDLGMLSVVHEPIGYHAAHGRLVVASRRADFPSPNELAVIRTATALVTTALETARVTHQREEALRAKDDFMAVLGHELRNPLAPITTALELIRLRNDGHFSAEEQVIRRQVAHLGRLVDDLLDVARIGQGTIELKRSRVEVSELVDQARETTASLFESRRQALRIDVPRSGLVVDGDPFRLSQVLINLLTNAAKYTPPGGHVEVSTAVRDGRLVLSVSDDGIGIGPQLLPRVFEPFVQGHQPHEVQKGGLGVGLALVRTLVELHGGTVCAKSAGTGHGSRFDVELPLALEPAIGPASKPHLEHRVPVTRARRVVIVDDNVDAGELLGEALAIAGHEVRVLHDPLAAVAMVEEFSAEVAVLDIGMPLLDGYGVAEGIRGRLGDRAPSLIALTGFGQPTDRERALAAGFVEHFVKPVDLAALVARIGEL